MSEMEIWAFHSYDLMMSGSRPSVALEKSREVSEMVVEMSGQTGIKLAFLTHPTYAGRELGCVDVGGAL